MTNGNIKLEFTVDVNRFEALNELNATKNVTSIYINIMVAHEKDAEASIPQKGKKKHHVPWENEDITNKSEVLKQQTGKHKFTRKKSSLLDKTKEDLDDAYATELEACIKGTVRTIQNVLENDQSALTWATITAITDLQFKVSRK